MTMSTAPNGGQRRPSSDRRSSYPAQREIELAVVPPYTLAPPPPRRSLPPPRLAAPPPALRRVPAPPVRPDTSDTDKTLEMPPKRPRAWAKSADMLVEIRAEDIVEVQAAHVACTSATPNATQEIRVDDVLEVIEAAPLPPVLAPRHVQTPSFAPTSVDVTLPPMKADWTLELMSEVRLLPRRRLGGMVAAVMVCAGAILGAALVRLAWPGDANATSATSTMATTAQITVTAATTVTPPATMIATASTNAPAPARTIPTVTTGAAPRPSAKPTPAKTIPLVDVSSLPRAPLGTIVAAGRGPLFVDNTYVNGRSMVVKCGSHKVRVGWTARTRTVEVPCSGEVRVP